MTRKVAVERVPDSRGGISPPSRKSVAGTVADFFRGERKCFVGSVFPEFGDVIAQMSDIIAHFVKESDRPAVQWNVGHGVNR